MSDSSLSIALAWLDAVNARDTERLLKLSDPEIEIVGPRGMARGHQILREWMRHAWLEFETLRTVENGDAVVVRQHTIWRNVETGEVIGEHETASQFRIAGGRIAFYARHDSPEEALTAAGLEEENGLS